jgi:hypothetical protein
MTRLDITDTKDRQNRARDYLARKHSEELDQRVGLIRTVALFLLVAMAIVSVVAAIHSAIIELPYTISAYEEALKNHNQGW